MRPSRMMILLLLTTRKLHQRWGRTKNHGDSGPTGELMELSGLHRIRILFLGNSPPHSWVIAHSVVLVVAVVVAISVAIAGGEDAVTVMCVLAGEAGEV